MIQTFKDKSIIESDLLLSSGRVGTVLVIEDDQALRAAVSMVLRQLGFSVIDVDGRAGMELFLTHLADPDADNALAFRGGFLLWENGAARRPNGRNHVWRPA